MWLTKVLARVRNKNGIYLGLSLFARVLNALGMFVALRRFAPATFGEMSYLLATAVSVVAFCSLGLELSVNAQLTRKVQEVVSIAPTIAASCALALAGIVLASVVIVVAFSSQLHVSNAHAMAVTAVCIYSSCMIVTSLLTAMCFALGLSVNVGVNYMITTLVFIAFAIFADARATGVHLLMFFIVGQVLGISYMIAGLLRRRLERGNGSAPLWQATRPETNHRAR